MTMQPTTLDVEEQIARIQRSNAELGKLVEESYKLNAEARKLSRDAWVLPITSGLSAIAAVIAVVVSAFTILHK